MVSNSIILAFFWSLSVNKIRLIILSNLIVELLPEYILVHSGLGAGLTTTGKHAAKGTTMVIVAVQNTNFLNLYVESAWGFHCRMAYCPNLRSNVDAGTVVSILCNNRRREGLIVACTNRLLDIKSLRKLLFSLWSEMWTCRHLLPSVTSLLLPSDHGRLIVFRVVGPHRSLAFVVLMSGRELCARYKIKVPISCTYFVRRT
jgi:hypothetical protein